PWLVTPDELEDARKGNGFDLEMTVTVNGVETSRGRWAEIVRGFGALASRASADVALRPGELLGSGTVGTGCLLEIREQTLGRYLLPGDEVALTVDRLGTLRNPVVSRPSARTCAARSGAMRRLCPAEPPFASSRWSRPTGRRSTAS